MTGRGSALSGRMTGCTSGRAPKSSAPEAVTEFAASPRHMYVCMPMCIDVRACVQLRFERFHYRVPGEGKGNPAWHQCPACRETASL